MIESGQIGRGYYSVASLKRRRAIIIKKLRKLDKMMTKAKKVPPSRRITQSQRVIRFVQVLRWRSLPSPHSYRQIGEWLKVSSARAQRIYLDAKNWKERRKRA